MAKLDADLQPIKGKPLSTERTMFWGDKHWAITDSDPKTGRVNHHHGGDCSLNGADYGETITCASQGTKGPIERTFHFRTLIEGDRLHPGRL